MVGIERCQIVTVAATKAGVLFEQAFLDVEAEITRLVVQSIVRHFTQRELINLTVGVQHVIQGFIAQRRLLSDQRFRPDLCHAETLSEIHHLPQI